MPLSRAARENLLEMLKTVRVMGQPWPMESKMLAELSVALGVLKFSCSRCEGRLSLHLTGLDC